MTTCSKYIQILLKDCYYIQKRIKNKIGLLKQNKETGQCIYMKQSACYLQQLSMPRFLLPMVCLQRPYLG
jgi:hypothetical protein